MRPPKTWLITDTHFFHNLLVERGYRPPDYNERIVKNWQRLVMEQDTVIHLGDVILSMQGKLAPILASLPGKKFLVRGNHDKESDNWYIRAGFAGVFQALLIGGVYLTHAPQANLPDGALINVHGHLHDDKHRPSGSGLHNKLLAIEQTDYKPVELNEFVGFTPITRKIIAPYEV